MATIKDLLSSMIRKINSKVSTWEELSDKPFGTKTEMVEIVPEQSVSGKGDEPVDISANGSFVEGETYTVKYDNAEYECIAYYVKEANMVSIGDGIIGGLQGYESTEPFFITILDGEGLACINGTHTISVRGLVEIVTPIDPKFTDNIFWVQVDNVAKREQIFDELSRAIMKGKKIIGFDKSSKLYTFDGIIEGNNIAITFTSIGVNEFSSGTGMDKLEFRIIGYHSMLGDKSNMWFETKASIKPEVHYANFIES